MAVSRLLVTDSDGVLDTSFLTPQIHPEVFAKVVEQRCHVSFVSCPPLNMSRFLVMRLAPCKLRHGVDALLVNRFQLLSFSTDHLIGLRQYLQRIGGKSSSSGARFGPTDRRVPQPGRAGNRRLLRCNPNRRNAIAFSCAH
jgi:hypothetical protein